jgi:sirohydrochlorin ferrochelatase
MIGELAERVGAELGVRVRTAFVDVLGLSPGDVLASLSGPAVLVPAFLAGGYHVRTDIPAHVVASGHPDVVVTVPLGPSAQMVHAMTDRMVESGWRPYDSVAMGAAGSSDACARADLRMTAALLSAAIGQPVEPAFAATGEPSVADAVADLRSRGARRVVVTSYLLADGPFQDRLLASGADVVTEPLGTTPASPG